MASLLDGITICIPGHAEQTVQLTFSHASWGTAITYNYDGMTGTLERPDGWDPNSGIRWERTVTLPFTGETEVTWTDVEGGDTPHSGIIKVLEVACPAPETTTTSTVPETTTIVETTTTAPPPPPTDTSTTTTEMATTTSAPATSTTVRSTTTTAASTTTAPTTTIPPVVETTAATTSTTAAPATTVAATSTTTPATSTTGATTTTVGVPPRLVETGSSADIMIPVGFALLTCGVIALWAARRRPQIVAIGGDARWPD